MGEQLHLITRMAVRAVDLTEFDADRLLVKAKARAIDPDVFSERTPFFWRVLGSNSSYDYYGSRMTKRTLENFAADAEAGVSFQISHDVRTGRGVGQTLAGHFRDAGAVDEDGVPISEMYADVFTLKGLQTNPWIGTTDFIDTVRSGMTKDVSVGFNSDSMQCSICGGDWYQGFFGSFGFDCEHVPGVVYDVVEGDKARQQRCWVWIDNGHLNELSDVYDGATSGAGYTKAAALAQRGRLDDRVRAQVEGQYRMALPAGPPGFWPGAETGAMTMAARTAARTAAAPTGDPAKPVDPVETVVTDPTTGEPAEPGTEVTPKPIEETTTTETTVTDPVEDDENDEETTETGPLEDRMRSVRAKYLPAGIAIGSDPVRAIDVLAGKVVELREQTALAEVGRQYKTDLIEEALGEGVRAMGATAFRPELYRGVMSGMSIDAIRAMRADWQRVGDEILRGGRVTRDSDAPEGGPEPVVPAEAYRVGP